MNFVVPELITSILDYVPDMRTCMLNRLWRDVVKAHNDYKNMLINNL